MRYIWGIYNIYQTPSFYLRTLTLRYVPPPSPEFYVTCSLPAPSPEFYVTCSLPPPSPERHVTCSLPRIAQELIR